MRAVAIILTLILNVVAIIFIFPWIVDVLGAIHRSWTKHDEDQGRKSLKTDIMILVGVIVLYVTLMALVWIVDLMNK